MVRVTPLQTGTVSIRPHHHWGEGGRGPIRRKIDMLLDKEWVEDLPIFTYLIEHPQGNFLVDSGDTAENAAKDYLPAWHPCFRHGVIVKVAPGEGVGDHLRAMGLDPAKDLKALILTHMHHDHAGGLHHFPHTPIIVTRENFLLANSWKGRLFGCLPQYFPRWLNPRLIEFSDQPCPSDPGISPQPRVCSPRRFPGPCFRTPARMDRHWRSAAYNGFVAVRGATDLGMRVGVSYTAPHGRAHAASWAFWQESLTLSDELDMIHSWSSWCPDVC